MGEQFCSSWALQGAQNIILNKDFCWALQGTKNTRVIENFNWVLQGPQSTSVTKNFIWALQGAQSTSITKDVCSSWAVFILLSADIILKSDSYMAHRKNKDIPYKIKSLFV